MTQQQLTVNNKGFALVLSEDESLTSSQRLNLIEKEIPPLQIGQVLIKMLASPVNPSDLVYLLGKYGLAPQNNAYCGFEGVGIVIDANAGFYGKWLTGKRVAISAQPGIDGVWAKYAITKANFCLPVRKEISDEQAATLIVNPCTSVCMVERAQALGAKSIVINAAASQVGKGAIRYAKLVGIKTIATVRSQTNVDVLTELGADHVLNTVDEDFDEKLNALATAINATVLLDAVAADDTPRTLKGMPKGSTAIVYGRLTDTHDPIGGRFSVADVIFRDIKIEGFWLATYIGKAKPWQVLALSNKVQKLFASGVFKTDIYASVGFSGFAKAIDHYAVHKSDGKVILRPHLDETV
ncbi:zinc-binding dehydrogenase [Thalassotalea piscium]|uniref:NADPH:quinone reductase-like Zn-dependent oxidoreductase n=1 Tax=Thalassotalea piscium TaxID=1230533 RepID=A0A7X0NF71_9GAMM|nr:zinc-binding dehydrogenase [Thalassotalea piscium]MBB6542228.1 NADPH:quinone reductase-like Zn-dependent oxidoreductase [Thalassotalea piscium]